MNNLPLGTYKIVRKANGRFDSLKAKLYRLTHFSLKWTAIFAAVAFTFLIGNLYNQYVQMNTVSVAFADTKTVEAPINILSRIADCESGNGKPGSASQFKNGQVLISINTNNTVDVGLYQINSIHFKEASALGYDLMTTAGNTAYAKYLFLNRGSGDWLSSAHCWQK